jgi:hypothetical protein
MLMKSRAATLTTRESAEQAIQFCFGQISGIYVAKVVNEFSMLWEEKKVSTTNRKALAKKNVSVKKKKLVSLATRSAPCVFN